MRNIDNNIVSEEEEIVECAVKYKNPRLLRPGMNYFIDFLCGTPLPTHTWASRPTQHGAFFGLFSIEKASFFAFVQELYHRKRLPSIHTIQFPRKYGIAGS